MSTAFDLSGFNKFPAAYPDRTERNPTKKTDKDGAWIRQMCLAGVSEFMRCAGSKMWYHGRADMSELLSYALGTQDASKYLRVKQGSTAAATLGDLGLDDPLGLDSILKAEPLPVLPVKLRALEALLDKQQYEASVTGLGPKAEAESRYHQAVVELWMDSGEAPRQLGRTPEGEGLPADLPQTQEEADTYLELRQVAAASMLEQKLLLANSEGKVEQQMTMCKQDLLRYGHGALFDQQRPGERPIPRRLFPGRVLAMPSAVPDCSDLTQAGFVERISIEQLQSEALAAGHKWGKGEWEEIKRLAMLSLPTGTQIDPTLGTAVQSGAVDVVRWFFLSDDDVVFKTSTTRDGNPVTRRKSADYKNTTGGGQVTRQTVTNLYEGTLVVGGSQAIGYNFRKAVEQGRDLGNPLRAALPFSFYVAGQIDGHPVSVVRNAKGLVDEIEREYRGFMADMRSYVPEGYQVSPKALRSAILKRAGGEKISEQEAYLYFLMTGGTFAEGIDPETKAVLGPSVVKNPTGIPDSAAKHLSHVFQLLQVLEAVTAANAVVSAATPTPEIGKGVAAMALQGAADVYSFLYKGQKWMFESMCQHLAARIAYTEHRNPVTGMLKGRNGKRIPVDAYPTLHEYRFHLDVKLAPTDQEWQQLMVDAKEAMATGELTWDDYMYLKWETNLKRAQRELAVRARRNRQRKMQEQLQLQKNNADVQTQGALQVEQAKQQTVQMANQLKMGELQFQRETTWGAIERQTEAQVQIGQLNAESKVQAAVIREQGQAEREEASDWRGALLSGGDVESVDVEPEQ